MSTAVWNEKTWEHRADKGDPYAIQISGNHYKDMAIQPIEYINANKMPFMDGCVIKYVSRWRRKNGVEDLRKARHFIDMMIDLEEKGKP